MTTRQEGSLPLERFPLSTIDGGKTNLTLSGENAFEPYSALFIERALHQGAIRQSDAVLLARNRPIRRVKKAKFNPRGTAWADDTLSRPGVRHRGHLSFTDR